MANQNTNVHTLDTSTFTATPTPKTIKEKFLSSLKMLKSDSKFIGVNVPFAHESYLKSKYGTIHSNEKRVDNFMAEIAAKIDTKNNVSKYVLIEEIPWDIIEFSEIIIKFFRDKGYIAHDVSQLVEGLARHYLFLAWDNFHLAQNSINIEDN